MTEQYTFLEPCVADAIAIAREILLPGKFDVVCRELNTVGPNTAEYLNKRIHGYFEASSVRRVRNGEDETYLRELLDIDSISVATTYGRACVAAIRAGLDARDVDGRYTGSNAIGCDRSEPSFAQASQSEEYVGLVLVRDDKPVAMQKKTGSEDTAIALEDFEVESELNGKVFVPKSALFTIGRSAVNGLTIVEDVRRVILDKVAIVRATSFSLPAGALDSSQHAPWFGMEKDGRGLIEIQRRVGEMIGIEQL